MLTFNAQSIRNKMDSFRALMAVEKPEIVGITETWISTDTTDFVGEYELSGYKIFKKDRVGKKGGGVLLYIKEDLNPVDCELVTEHEMVGVVLKNLKKELYLYLVYRPPHQAVEKDVSLYSKLRSVIKDKFCIITGDFNCPKVNWKHKTADIEGRRLLEFASDELLTQWVNEGTRGSNILDLVFSSEDDLISNVEVRDRLGKSDHNMVKFEIKTNFSPKKRSFMKPDFKNANFERLRNEASKIERSSDVDVEIRWSSFRDKYQNVRNNCIQQKNVILNKPEQPKWFNKHIAKQIGEREKAYNLSKKYPTQENIEFHRQQCRKVDRMVKKGKLENEDRVAAASIINNKIFFAHVNSRKPIKSAIGPLKDAQGNIISSDEGMAELLNEYFVSVYTKEDLEEIPSVPILYQGTKPLRKINLTIERVREKIRKLNGNKSPGSTFLRYI